MKKIKIFVAGSKSLVKEREVITKVANKINTENEYPYSLTVYDYDFFGDKQDEYNEFIQHKADIAIFIIDGKMGDKTREEFLKATEAFNEKNRPEIMIFLKEPVRSADTPDSPADKSKEDKDFEQFGEVKGLIAGRLGSGKYYTEYTNIGDLESNAYKKIRWYTANPRTSTNTRTDNLDSMKGSGVTDNGRNANRMIRIVLFFVMVFLIGGVAGVMCWNLFRHDDKLVFVGGGSVKNFIKDTRKIDVGEYSNSIYCNLASGSAWNVLMEEANTLTICLSADDIDTASVVNEKTKNMFTNSRIIGYRLGWDTLKIFVHNSIYTDKKPSHDGVSISVDSLRSLMKYALDTPQRIRIYSTTKTSGTLRYYQSCFETRDSIDLGRLLDTEQILPFWKDSEAAFFNSYNDFGKVTPYMILCSAHYFPESLVRENDHKELYVMDGTEYVLKPMNMYFLAHYNGQEPNYFTIEKSIVGFMKAINAGEDIDSETWTDLRDGKVRVKDRFPIRMLN